MHYNGSLTREQFMFQEMRISARLRLEGLIDKDIIAKVYEGNLFQYPTQREIKSKCRWCVIVCHGGEEFNPNMPTEELFITPKRGLAEGIVYSSKPLSYRGQIIDHFWIRFHEGKAVEAYAEQSNDLLQQMITMDEGAAYLGECALVPYHSPISQSGLTFFETLFDENASCHLAMGAGYSNTVKDYDKYTLEQLHEMGVNDSMIHVDFMIGTEDLSVIAHTSDGRSVPLFENGDWAF